MGEEKGLEIDLGVDSLMEMQENQSQVRIEEDKKKDEIIKDYSSDKKKKKKKKKGGKTKDQKILSVAFTFIVIFTAVLIYGLWDMKVINNKIKESVHLLEKYEVKVDLKNIIKENAVFAGSEFAKKVDSNAEGREVDLYDMIDIEDNLAIERDRIIANYTRYEAPYKYFLEYIYLPRLNVWKNPFTQKVNINLFGKNYIDANPYVDTKLLEKWSLFFVENNHDDSRNDIKTIRIDDLDIDDENNSFFIPIDVSVKVDDRRTFLAMLSKLTMTANTKTVMDINEFTYYLWEALVEYYEDFSVLKHKEYKDDRNYAITYETKFLQSDSYVVDKKGALDIDKLEQYIKTHPGIVDTEGRIKDDPLDSKYYKEGKLYLYFLQKKLNFSYSELENMELYLQDIENGIENLDTPEIESEYYPIYLVYLYKNFDSYKEDPTIGDDKEERKMRENLKKEEEMMAIKNDKNPIYKFVGMRFYSWVKDCELTESSDKYAINTYSSCNNHIIIKPSVIAKAIYTYTYNGRFNEFEGDIVTEDVASMFRENMKDIPYIQYSLGKYYLTKQEAEILKDSKNVSYRTIKAKKDRIDGLLLKGLHDVYSNIPPLIKIGNFNFAQLKNNSIYGNGYDVTLNMAVYGQGIADDEITEIQEEIGLNCGMQKTHKFTIDIAIERVEEKLEKLYNDDIKNNSEYVYDLKTILEIFQVYNEEYDKKSRFDKIIVLLESYRMLDDRGYCDLEDDELESETE